MSVVSTIRTLGGRVLSSAPVVAALLGLILVLLNLGLAWRGMSTGHLYRYFMFAGAIDGFVVSLIVVAQASDGFQTMVIGLLTGVGLDNIASQQTTARRVIGAIADGIRVVVQELNIPIAMTGLTGEQTQRLVQTAVICAVWTLLFVVLASLLGNWAILSVRKVQEAKPVEKPSSLEVETLEPNEH